MKTRIPRKLKKKYKKLGLYEALQAVDKYFMSPTFIALRKQAFEDLVLFGEAKVTLSKLDLPK